MCCTTEVVLRNVKLKGCLYQYIKCSLCGVQGMYCYNLAITLVSVCKVPVSSYSAVYESNARGQPHTVMGLVPEHTQDFLRAFIDRSGGGG